MFKKIIKEFKDFALKGNVLDLAVGVLIGGAFQSLVKSLTDNIISPLLGIFGEVDFSEYVLTIGNLNLKYGAFITDIINFLIMAFIIFMLVKGMNRLADFGKKEEAPAAPTTKKCPYCCSEIDIEATKCPHCTSDIEIKESVK
ncbi:MAG: large conductance mechanosensitive channel protein MscL [Clostridia bacterium]|nr:large conductance mechanosensitive channel protein MscL [Clostridia bacterium]